MNAVWLSDDLMVTPGMVVGLQLWWCPDLKWEIQAVSTLGERWSVWSSEWGDKAVLREKALAEMARLSELLWPSPLRWCQERTKSFPMGRMDFGRCVLELGHEGDHDFR